MLIVDVEDGVALDELDGFLVAGFEQVLFCYWSGGGVFVLVLQLVDDAGVVVLLLLSCVVGAVVGAVVGTVVIIAIYVFPLLP